MAKKAATSGDFVGLAAPARRALASAGIKSLAGLTTWKEADVAALHGMGPNALKLLQTKLRDSKLTFARR